MAKDMTKGVGLYSKNDLKLAPMKGIDESGNYVPQKESKSDRVDANSQRGSKPVKE